VPPSDRRSGVGQWCRAMRKSNLHEYDLRLCDYAVGTVAGHFIGVKPVPPREDPVLPPAAAAAAPNSGDTVMRRPRLDPMRRYARLPPAIALTTWLEDSLDGHLLRHLRHPARPRLLLTYDQFEDFAQTIEDAPTVCAALEWTPWEALHRDHVHCLREIRHALAAAEAEDFAARSRGYAEQLEARGLKLWDGVRIMSDWVSEVRRLLRALGRVDLLPLPEGRARTPLSSEAVVNPNVNCYVERIRTAIAKDPAVAGWTRSAVRALVKGRTEHVYAALDLLEAAGEYRGARRGSPDNAPLDERPKDGSAAAAGSVTPVPHPPNV
jgi:hypothetical protein